MCFVSDNGCNYGSIWQSARATWHVWPSPTICNLHPDCCQEFVNKWNCCVVEEFYRVSQVLPFTTHLTSNKQIYVKLLKQERHLDTKETLLSFRCEILYFNDKGQECSFSIRNLVETRLGNERESKKPLLTRVVNDYLRYILKF